MSYKRYMHIERFGTTEVDGIEFGETYVFPKIDGTNGTVWVDDGKILAGSRNRELTIDNDNQGFYNYILNDTRIQSYLAKHPEHRLFGEWLVPHSLKTYRDDTWRKFYIFDISVDKENEDVEYREYIPYNIYKPMLDEFGLDYISPICIIKNGDYQKFVLQLENNNFLIKDGMGTGEGVVLKNYNFYNKFGRQTWAKIVKSEFKELHGKEMGCPVMKGATNIEDQILKKYCTLALIEKTYAKIVNECNGWTSKLIPRLLNTVYYELVKEESWNFVKQFKNPTINFKVLQNLVIQKIKELKPEIFC